MGLAAGALDQFVEIFGAPSPSVLGTVEDSRSNKICRFFRVNDP